VTVEGGNKSNNNTKPNKSAAMLLSLTPESVSDAQLQEKTTNNKNHNNTSNISNKMKIMKRKVKVRKVKSTVKGQAIQDKLEAKIAQKTQMKAAKEQWKSIY